MTEVRAIRVDIPGLEVAAAVDGAGTYWLVIGRDAPRPHFSAATALEEVLGGLPDRLVLDCTESKPPDDVHLRLVS